MLVLHAILMGLVALPAVQAETGPESGPPAEAVWTLTDWSYRWDERAEGPSDLRGWSGGDSAWTSIETPYYQGFRPRGAFWVRTRLPDRLPDRADLVLPIVILDFEAYVDSVRFSSARSVTSYAGSKFASGVSYMIDLPPDAAGKWLYLRVTSASQQIIGLPLLPYVGTPFAVLRRAWLERAGLFALGLLCAIVGLGALLLLLTLRRRAEILMVGSFALLALSVGGNYLTDSTFVRIIFPFPVGIYYASFLVIFFPVGLLGFFEQAIGAGPGRIVRWMTLLHLAFGLVLVGLDVAGVLAIPEFFLPFFALLAVSLVVICLVAVSAVRKGQYEARVFGFAMLVAMLLGMHDTLFLGLGLKPDQPPLSQYGFLLLVVVVGYLLQYRFRENTRQLEDRTAELASANATLEERVAERTEALQASLRHLQSTQTRLVQQEKMASLGALTAGIAHEIKNPLNFVNNFAALSRELVGELGTETDPVEAEAILRDLRFNAEKIEEHGRRADAIVRAMMQHASGTEGTREPTDVNALVAEYVDLAYHGRRAQAPGFQVEIRRDLDAETGVVDLVPQEIGRVLLNLLSNAFDSVIARQRDHRPEGSLRNEYTPTVAVSTRRVDSADAGQAHHVEIRVSDNGAGIPEEVQDRIFEPFFTTKPPGKGTGLGLSLSYEIVTQGHGGALSVESTEGVGTTFVVTLPAA